MERPVFKRKTVNVYEMHNNGQLELSVYAVQEQWYLKYRLYTRVAISEEDAQLLIGELQQAA